MCASTFTFSSNAASGSTILQKLPCRIVRGNIREIHLNRRIMQYSDLPSGYSPSHTPHSTNS